ncbi:MAG TPA: hypothetical protein VGI50_17295, partial [Solirubrobacteraceae bacterium]
DLGRDQLRPKRPRQDLKCSLAAIGQWAQLDRPAPALEAPADPLGDGDGRDRPLERVGCDEDR